MGGRKRKYKDKYHRLNSLLASRSYHKSRGNTKEVRELNRRIKKLRNNWFEPTDLSNTILGKKKKRKRR